ncbi:MAG TPA: hypothetical protein V6C98_03875, partial [Thermosynechococcaceae cyanobacterium]
MGQVSRSQVLKLHQVIGYWGYGTHADLEQRLTSTLRQLGQPFSDNYVRRIGRSPQTKQKQHTPTNDPVTCVWGAAYLGLQEADCDRLPTGTIAALSASRLGQRSGKTLDAWATVDDQHLHLGADQHFRLGREPFGHVPLYWIQMGQVLWLASRLSLLLPLVEAPQISLPA